ncbi:Transposon Ty3-G Gag-Pol polyprotein [Gossypium australe]|uniref:Transposon Ty3-G Gag-Pol polyprotein n=1 Tax=Gossypium australe TaxID=47621 RepID=A0A5B6VPX4_9ROSI|nr:Transposon Ty3-G Gag-Pol polyprotein [Gossypium australe]
MDMPGVDLRVIMYRLNVLSKSKPVKQKKRKFAPHIIEAVRQEVTKFLVTRFIREVEYPDWISNIMMIKKVTGKWGMCIDLTNMNKACPKDSFPLPSIDRLVDAFTGHKVMSFMDAFSGYNQILLGRGLFCYRVMPFGLKNAGATYQRLVNKIFKEQIGHSLEVYINDMLVKSESMEKHVRNLIDAFAMLRAHNMKLNPEKFAFGVWAGKFLGFMILERGIEANLEKNPSHRRDALLVVALNRFISRMANKCLPYFRSLRKPFSWTEECQTTFEQPKEYLNSPHC